VVKRWGQELWFLISNGNIVKKRKRRNSSKQEVLKREKKVKKNHKNQANYDIIKQLSSSKEY
jgi:hypothetical protein